MKAESTQKGNLRWYPCPLCGNSHPSITTILGVIGSPALMGWAAKNGTAKLKIYSDIVQETLEHTKIVYGKGECDGNETLDMLKRNAEQRWKLTEDTAFWKSGKETGQDAADIGTMCHAWIEAHLHGKRPSIESLPEQGQKAVMSMLTWEAEHKLETIKTEETFYNCKLNYAGTSDWVGRLDDVLSLGDWKTSTGIFFNYVIQGWGYALADETQNADRLYKQIFIGRFGKDGSSEVKIFKRNSFPSIETAREVLTACGVIFGTLQEWDRRFPYQRKVKERVQN